MHLVITAVGALSLFALSASATTHPDEKTFTDDRIDCINQELDVRQLYGHRFSESTRPEGIDMAERPSLKLQFFIHTLAPNRVHDPTLDKFYIIRNGVANQVDKQTLHQEVKKHISDDLAKKFFSVVWRTCRAEQGKHK